MSVRQNKKRKAKSNRERTITALTIIEDIPSHLKRSPFSIADHDQVQPTAPLTFPFPVTSSSGSVVGNPVAASPQVVASPIYLHHPSVRYESFLAGMQHPQQAHFFPQSLPSPRPG
ncbi:hypothetical protein B0F90DRAFT_677308 [Multifurca ochricompacta]|uniref:Uncharacterized protein n=1 Tax=Multifurca ochricompacta TaxID=376703 RepID=A0AAD4LWG5_9AGAM|nr:hypothetical protein B0F90DRAFT_677308 [Multifurca ochricompacta]